MNSQRKWLVGIIVVLLIINIATIGTFWWTKRPKHPPKLEHIFKKELDLSKEQVAEFEKLAKTHRQKGQEMHKSMKGYKDSFFKEMLSENPNQQTLDNLSQQISALQVKLDMNLVNHFNELKAICDSEVQQEKLRKVFLKSIKRPRKPRK